MQAQGPPPAPSGSLIRDADLLTAASPGLAFQAVVSAAATMVAAIQSTQGAAETPGANEEGGGTRAPHTPPLGTSAGTRVEGKGTASASAATSAQEGFGVGKGDDNRSRSRSPSGRGGVASG